MTRIAQSYWQVELSREELIGNEIPISKANNLKVTIGALKSVDLIIPGAKYPEGHLRRRGI